MLLFLMLTSTELPLRVDMDSLRLAASEGEFGDGLRIVPAKRMGRRSRRRPDTSKLPGLRLDESIASVDTQLLFVLTESTAWPLTSESALRQEVERDR